MEFQALAQAYLTRHLSKKSSYKSYQGIYNQFFAGWTQHPTRKEIRAWFESIEKTPCRANKALGFLKAMYRWATIRELWEGENPARDIVRFKTYSRERTFTNTELSKLLLYLEFTQQKLAALLTLILCTGCRVGEARAMKWAYLDFESGCWFKPTTKNGMSQRLPIPRQALEALKLLPRTDEVYVFPGYYAHCWSRPGVEKAWRKFSKEIGLGGLNLHDFRRTVATKIYEHEKDELLVKAVLNHYDGRPIAVYIRQQFDRIATALQANADRFFALKYDAIPDIRPSVSVPVQSPTTKEVSHDAPSARA